MVVNKQFSDEESAKRMADKLRANGFEVEMRREGAGWLVTARLPERASHPCAPSLLDIPFAMAKDVGTIQYRLASIDAGFDPRVQGMAIGIDPRDDPIRISYADAEGHRRVISGLQDEVLPRLEKLGYKFKQEMAPSGYMTAFGIQPKKERTPGNPGAGGGRYEPGIGGGGMAGKSESLPGKWRLSSAHRGGLEKLSDSGHTTVYYDEWGKPATAEWRETSNLGAGGRWEPTTDLGIAEAARLRLPYTYPSGSRILIHDPHFAGKRTYPSGQYKIEDGKLVYEQVRGLPSITMPDDAKEMVEAELAKGITQGSFYSGGTATTSYLYDWVLEGAGGRAKPRPQSQYISILSMLKTAEGDERSSSTIQYPKLRDALLATGDPDFAKVINAIIEDEKKHEGWLRDIRTKLESP